MVQTRSWHRDAGKDGPGLWPGLVDAERGRESEREHAHVHSNSCIGMILNITCDVTLSSSRISCDIRNKISEISASLTYAYMSVYAERAHFLSWELPRIHSEVWSQVQPPALIRLHLRWLPSESDELRG
jgi:hypothetical protein